MSAGEEFSDEIDDARVVIGNADRYSGIVLAGLSAFAVFKASHLPFGTISAPDAGFFPISLSVLLLVVSIVIVLLSFFRAPQQTRFGNRSWFVVLAILALVVYALVVQTVGFAIATLIILLLMMRGFGGMSWTRALLIAIPAVLLSYFGFLQLGVPLPRGLLPF